MSATRTAAQTRAAQFWGGPTNAVYTWTELIRSIPEDPFGGVYRIDPVTGTVVSSSGHVRLGLYESERRRRLRDPASQGDG